MFLLTFQLFVGKFQLLKIAYVGDFLSNTNTKCFWASMSKHDQRWFPFSIPSPLTVYRQMMFWLIRNLYRTALCDFIVITCEFTSVDFGRVPFFGLLCLINNNDFNILYFFKENPRQIFLRKISVKVIQTSKRPGRSSAKTDLQQLATEKKGGVIREFFYRWNTMRNQNLASDHFNQLRKSVSNFILDCR